MIPSLTSTATTAATSANRQDALQKLFARLDADEDGQINQDEFTEALSKRLGTEATSDTSQIESIFGEIDGDADGKITVDEFKQGLQTMRGAGGPPPPPPGPPPTGGPAGGSSEELWSEIDADGDGSATIEELTADFAAREAERAEKTGSSGALSTEDFAAKLKEFDEDGDGSLTSTEFESFWQAMREEQGPPPPPEGYNFRGGPTQSTETAGQSLETEA